MIAQRDARWSRAAQVGMLMRAYRETFPVENGKRGLTQAGLLQRMSEINGQYAERYSHVTVSRWESGTTLPNVERLCDFGRALNLAPVEIEGLMILAGFQETASAGSADALGGWTGSGDGTTANRETRFQATSAGGAAATSPRDGRAGDRGPGFLAPDMGSIIRYLAYKCVLMGVGIAVVGYALAAFGWDNTWMPAGYVVAVMCLVAAQGLLFRRPPHDLDEFYSTTVFFLLSTFLLQSSAVRMDHYGLYAVRDFGGTHIPFLLALEVNLALATIAGLAFHLLRQWHYSGDQGRSNALRRAVAVAFPPTLFAYACIVVISNIALWVQLVLVLPPLAVVFTALLVLRDPAVQPNQHDCRLALRATVAFLAVMGTIGAAVVAALYLAPNLPSVLPDYNSWTSWEIDFSQLGYPREEALERLNRGYLWHGLATFLYLVVVFGGVLITSLYRMGRGDPAITAVRGPEPGNRRCETATARIRQAASGETNAVVATDEGFRPGATAAPPETAARPARCR